MCFEKPPLSWLLETHVASACLQDADCLWDAGYLRGADF